jgi:hypothetical protein
MNLAGLVLGLAAGSYVHGCEVPDVVYCGKFLIILTSLGLLCRT